MAEGGSREKLESAPYQGKGADQVLYSVTDLVRKSIVFIKARSGLGTGSIVKFKDKPWLMTCAHVIPSKEFARKSRIFFDKVSGIDSDDGECKSGEELLDFESAPLIDEDLDVALFAIKSGKVPKLVGGKQRLELDLSAYQQDGLDCSAKERDVVKLWHYSKEGKYSLQNSSYFVLAVSGTRFSHGAETHPGSSGAPVFKTHGGVEVLVGLHRSSLPNSSPAGLNVATHIHAIWCLLSKKEHGLGVPNLDVLGLKGSGKEIRYNESRLYVVFGALKSTKKLQRPQASNSQPPPPLPPAVHPYPKDRLPEEIEAKEVVRELGKENFHGYLQTMSFTDPRVRYMMAQQIISPHLGKSLLQTKPNEKKCKLLAEAFCTDHTYTAAHLQNFAYFVKSNCLHGNLHPDKKEQIEGVCNEILHTIERLRRVPNLDVLGLKGSGKVPSQVTGVRLSVVISSSESGQAAIKVTWTKPSSDRPIIRYNVQYGPTPAHPNRWANTVSVQGADSLTTTLTGLGRRSYDVRVLAVSDAGVGPYSATATLRVPSQVSPPTVTKAVSSGRPAQSLTVSWSAPQSDSSITKYELQYRKTPSGGWMSRDVTSTSTTLPNLDTGTGYTVRVRAVSGVGNGPFSAEKRQTTFNVPSRVTGVKLSDVSSSSVSGQASIKVTWTKPSSGPTIIRYHVQYGPTPAHPDRWANTVSVQGAESLTTTLTGLGRRSYDVRVVAVSDVGFGLYSTTSTLSTARDGTRRYADIKVTDVIKRYGKEKLQDQLLKLDLTTKAVRRREKEGVFDQDVMEKLIALPRASPVRNVWLVNFFCSPKGTATTLDLFKLSDFPMKGDDPSFGREIKDAIDFLREEARRQRQHRNWRVLDSLQLKSPWFIVLFLLLVLSICGIGFY